MAGVPVLQRVAAIFCAMRPDLPTPIKTTLPECLAIKSTTLVNDPSRRCESSVNASASAFNKDWADWSGVVINYFRSFRAAAKSSAVSMATG